MADSIIPKGNGCNTNNRSATHKDKKAFSTHDGHMLTPNELKFITTYMETGNGAQAVKEAYPKSNPKTASQQANKILARPHINSEILYLMQKQKDEKIADRDELLEFFTKGMRGQLKDQFGIEMSVGDRLRYGVELAKRTMDIEDKLQSNQEQPELKITLDWAKPNTDEQTIISESINVSDQPLIDSIDGEDDGK